MATLKLKFISPKVLNELKYGQSLDLSDSPLWQYSGMPESSLLVDTETWVIATEDNTKAAIISEWSVSEDSHEFILSSEASTGFKSVDYVFALAMLGQLVDQHSLKSYLDSLQDAFDGISPQKENEDKDIDANEV